MGWFIWWIFIIGSLWLYFWSRSQQKKNAIRKAKLDAIQKIEDERGNHVKFLNLSLYLTDLTKAGYPADYDSYIFLISQTDGLVHFAYEGSPELRLISVDHSARFTHTTKGKVSGRTGSALIGAAWAGNVGAAIGGSGSRKVNTTTTDQEVGSSGLLTFQSADGTGEFAVEAVITSDTVHALMKDFIYRSTSPDNTSTDSVQSSSDAAEAELTRFKGMLDNGLITQDDYDEKKKELLNLP